MKNSVCSICGAGDIPKGYDAHRLCVERKKRGVATPPLVGFSSPEVKLFQGQLFEKINNEWKKIL